MDADNQPDQLRLRTPDDWHVHLRDGEMLAGVAGYTACQFGRAIVMPNLKPPITTVAQARDYPALLRARRFWGYALCMAFSTGAFYAFLGGAPLVASEERSGDPLPGVEVRADGRLLGVTDANGELALRAPERPDRLEFQLAGHSVADTTGPLFRSGRLKRRPGNPLSEVYGVSLQAD